MVRGNKSDIRFDARFLDTKTSEINDHPWRMGVNIDTLVASWDNRWHHVYIPFSAFNERGAWDNGTWYNPQGKFDWAAIDRFEFSTEYTGTSGNEIWFDNIILTNLDTAIVRENGTLSIPAMPSELLGLHAVPNPMKQNTSISYSLPENSQVNIDIYTITGSRFCSLFSGFQTSGKHILSWNGSADSGCQARQGVYICLISTRKVAESCMIIKS